MRTPRIYLETTMFNFPFADDAPQYRDDTRHLLNEIKAGKFQPFTSVYATGEIEDTQDEDKRERMKAPIDEYSVEVLEATGEIRRLASVYITEGVIKERFLTDALHIAAATVYGMDMIVSLNFQHIVKHKTIIETEIINAREGYRRIFIHT
ncbi:MAG: hypothetical protein LBQ44_10800, partial [Treponema sp.]|nr:hypothetical protein [Treponema sp.]